MINFTQEELHHVVNAMNEYLYNYAKLERQFNIKIIDTLTTISSAQKKIITAFEEGKK